MPGFADRGKKTGNDRASGSARSPIAPAPWWLQTADRVPERSGEVVVPTTRDRLLQKLLQAKATRASSAASAVTPSPAGSGAPSDARTDGASDGAIHEIAAQGLSGTGRKLPHLERIEASFGRNNLSGVEAHLGSDATAASLRMGAVAYATGNRVAFAGAPDLHTAAHEAAHVVQQRGGLHLKDGVGAPGDAHEQHADAVADRVVAGRGAEDLLAPYGERAPGASTPPVQRKPKNKKKQKKTKEQGPKFVGKWVEYSTPAQVYEETAQATSEDAATGEAPERTFAKTDETLGKGEKHRKRQSLVDDEANGYVHLVPVDEDPVWIQRSKVVGEVKHAATLKGKTVEVVAKPEAEIAIGTRLAVLADDLENGRILVQTADGQAWIARSHVVEYHQEHELPAQTAGDQASVDAAWAKFASSFNEEFKEILHAFVPEGAKGGIDGGWASTHFTIPQRDALVRFFTTKLIPDRLFIGDGGVGGLTGPQRILIASHLLTYGQYADRNDDGDPQDPAKLHARNCGHWVQVVNNYAGVTAATGDDATGVYGSFDFAGNVVLGGGSYGETFREKAQSYKDLPAVENKKSGPVHAGTGQADTLVAQEEAVLKSEMDDLAELMQPAGAGDKTKKKKKKSKPKVTVKRFPHLPIEQFDQVQPGDWLWLYNGNSSDSGGHSLVFVEWVDTKVQVSKSGIQYRRALTFSQPHPPSGGTFETRRLGEMFSPGEYIDPITSINRHGPDSTPATDEQSLLPIKESRYDKAEKLNDAFMAGKRKRKALDPEKLRTWLAQANEACVEALGERLTDTQRQLLANVNQETDLVMLVLLWQKLSALVTNAGVIAKGKEKDKKNKMHSVHAGDLKAEAKLKLTGLLTDVPYIDKHRSEFQADDAPPPSSAAPANDVDRREPGP